MAAKVSPSSKIKKCHDDRISELPDVILGHIFSSLSTRDIVLTSILSKRWRSVWTSAPSIEIQDYWVESEKLGFPDVELRFTNFVDRVLRLNEFSCLKRISLTCRKIYELSRVSEWISSMARLDVEELELDFLARQCVELPQSIFTCKKLVTLKLRKGVILNVPSSSSSVSLPSLKVLRLVEVADLDHDSMNNLLIGCPTLKELYIARSQYDNLGNKTLYVQSSTLKSLTFYSGGDWRPSHLSKMVIDANHLEQLDLKVGVMEKIEVINSLSSLVRVKLDLECRCSRWEIHRIPVVELLRNVSNTKHLYLSYKTLESLDDGHYDNMTMLKNLTHLEVHISSFHCPILSCVLDNEPNLISFVLTKKSLSLRNIMREGDQQFHIRNCKMSYLESVELKGFLGHNDHEMEMVRYFLKNAPVLKKMSIRFHPYTTAGVFFFRHRLLKTTSAACEIEVAKIQTRSMSCSCNESLLGWELIVPTTNMVSVSFVACSLNEWSRHPF